MHGFPPITAGFCVIRSSSAMLLSNEATAAPEYHAWRQAKLSRQDGWSGLETFFLLDDHIRWEHTTLVLHLGVVTQRVPHPRFMRVGNCPSYAKAFASPLRQGRSTLHYLQLLPAVASVRNRGRAKCLRGGAPQGTPGIQICSRGLCGDAGACPLIDERTEEGNTFHGAANAQTAGIQDFAEEAARVKRATPAVVSPIRE